MAMQSARSTATDERLDELETWTEEGFNYLKSFMKRERERSEREIRDLREEVRKLRDGRRAPHGSSA
jgi:hypothetical protein